MGEQERWMRDYLASVGATDLRTVPGGKHPRLIWTWRGKEMQHIVSASASENAFSPKKAVADIKRMTGLAPTGRRVGAKRQHKKKAKARAVSAPPALSPLPDFRDRLYASLGPAQLRRQLDAAFLGYWRQCMRAVGGASGL